MTKQNSLTNIVNMVSVQWKEYTEVFIATCDQDYGRFVIPKNSTALSFEKLTEWQYLAATQNRIGNSSKLTINYANRAPSES